MEREAAVGLNKVLVRVEAGAGAGASAGAGETYASADDFAGVVDFGICGTGGSGVLGADFAEDEYGVSGRELELGRVRVEASEVVDSVNEARRATEGWMTGKECVYAGFCASFVYFVMGRPGMQVTTRGGSESMRLAASVALDGPNAFAVLDDEDGLRVVEGVRWGGGGWSGDASGLWDWDCGGGDGSSWVGIGPADFKRKEEGG